jgi:hypothetical protein
MQGKGFIAMYVAREFESAVHNAATARDAWVQPQQGAQRYNQARLQDQERDLHNMWQHDAESVRAFIARGSTLLRNITQAGGHVSEMSLCDALIGGLRPELAARVGPVMPH